MRLQFTVITVASPALYLSAGAMWKKNTRLFSSFPNFLPIFPFLLDFLAQFPLITAFFSQGVLTPTVLPSFCLRHCLQFYFLFYIFLIYHVPTNTIICEETAVVKYAEKCKFIGDQYIFSVNMS